MPARSARSWRPATGPSGPRCSSFAPGGRRDALRPGGESGQDAGHDPNATRTMTSTVTVRLRGVAVLVPALMLLSVTAPASAVAATAAALARSAWPQYQGGAGHTGWDRGESILDPANVGGLAVRW